MSFTRRKGFFRQEVNKTMWELPRRYTAIIPVGSGAYGSVWWVALWISGLWQSGKWGWIGIYRILESWILRRNHRESLHLTLVNIHLHSGKKFGFLPATVFNVILSVSWSGIERYLSMGTLWVANCPFSARPLVLQLFGILIFRQGEAQIPCCAVCLQLEGKQFRYCWHDKLIRRIF